LRKKKRKRRRSYSGISKTLLVNRKKTLVQQSSRMKRIAKLKLTRRRKPTRLPKNLKMMQLRLQPTRRPLN
jgi:hypothetical protein